MANPPRKASSSNKWKEMATKPSSPQSKKRVSVGASNLNERTRLPQRAQSNVVRLGLEVLKISLPWRLNQPR